MYSCTTATNENDDQISNLIPREFSEFLTTNKKVKGFIYKFLFLLWTR